VKNTRSGKGGVRVTTIKNPDDRNETSEEISFLPPPGKPPGQAQVGLSLTAGMSTEWAREKIEVSAWCTLPCDDDPAAIQATYDTCYSWVLQQVQEKLDDASNLIFPPVDVKQEN
jgi:hypothetical protein